jgi:hypothetical protein
VDFVGQILDKLAIAQECDRLQSGHPLVPELPAATAADGSVPLNDLWDNEQVSAAGDRKRLDELKRRRRALDAAIADFERLLEKSLSYTRPGFDCLLRELRQLSGNEWFDRYRPNSFSPRRGLLHRRRSFHVGLAD